MQEKGELINLTKIVRAISKFRSIDDYASNNFTYYYGGIFPSTQIINNIPVLYFNEIDEYVLFEFTIPDNGFVDNVNFVNFTPYIYSYQEIEIFGSTDRSIGREFFIPKLQPGDTIKIVLTSSETIGEHFKSQGYIISKLPYNFLKESTVTFLLRIGNKSGEYNPGPLERYSKLVYGKFVSTEKLIPYNSFEIIASQPIPLESKYLYTGLEKYLLSLLTLYNNQKQELLMKGYTELPTYLYLQNLANPPVNYAFESFYDCITVSPYQPILGNNTGESYFNTDLINLNNYVDTTFVVLAVNQNKFGYGIYSNIQGYNNTGLQVIENLSYSTSPPIPVISNPKYPYADNDNPVDGLKYPLINIKEFKANDLLATGIEEIYFSERVGYNPINFNHSNNYTIPRFSIFIKN
jgi:hypothetical protein